MSWTTVQEYLDDPGGYEAHRGGEHGDTCANDHCSTEASYIFTVPPKRRTCLIINENFIVEFVKPMPGWWHRFWYRLLLGWRWEET